jgi:carboxymethylenebutenolidase
MPLEIDTIRYGADGEHSGIFALPGRGARPLPGIIVIHEAGGLDPATEDIARRFAAAGYAALAPDLFSLRGERPAALTRERVAELYAFANAVGMANLVDARSREQALAARPEAERARLGESIAAMFAAAVALDAHLPALVAAARHLRDDNPVTRGQKIGSVGFCMGGGLSALLACSVPDLGAAAIFYGVAPSEERVARIRCPVIGFYGALDARINAGIPGLVAAMQKHGKAFEYHVYEGAGHAFFNDYRASYDVRAARDAFVRVLAFFRQHLAG